MRAGRALAFRETTRPEAASCWCVGGTTDRSRRLFGMIFGLALVILLSLAADYVLRRIRVPGLVGMLLV